MQSDALDGFDFRADGFFLDPFGAPCVLLGTVEFTDFWNAFDACFSSPMGRKLIYAATDAEEDILRGSQQIEFGKWFGRRRAASVLAARPMSMGWGRFDADRIHVPSNDALSVGFALAHQEFLQRQRFALSWNQLSADHISIELKPNQQAMTAPLSIKHLPWLSSNDVESATSRQHAIEIDHRGSTLYAGEARSFFLPVAVLQRLVCGLRGRPAVVDGDASLLALDGSIEEPDLFRAVVHAALSAYHRTERPVYLQRSSDWAGHLTQRISERGFGRVEVLQSVLDNDDTSVFLIVSHLPALVAGTVLGMWLRAHGKRGNASFSMVDGLLKMTVEESQISYD